jgi:hypothetical protein
MICQTISLPDGSRAIVCGPGSRQRCTCGRRASLLCDWKVKGKKSGTCDRPICDRCALSPAEGKDLCPEHAVAYEAWRQRPGPSRRIGRAAPGGEA